MKLDCIANLLNGNGQVTLGTIGPVEMRSDRVGRGKVSRNGRAEPRWNVTSFSMRSMAGRTTHRIPGRCSRR